MLFNSFEFILVFLPVVVFGFYLLRAFSRFDESLIFLAVASLVFYSYWDIRNLPVILVSLAVNYGLARRLIARHCHASIVLGVVFNLGLLAYFKYTVFFVSQFNEAIASTLSIALPLAISFFTFQQIGYLVDCYQGKIHEQSLLNYTLFVTFFPQLIAGPIVHHESILGQYDQLKHKRFVVPYKAITSGVYIFSLGLAKKVLIADNLAAVVNPIFANPQQLEILDAWVGAFFYTFQLYFDFSGYCDMAIGLGLLFGIMLPINFDSPYKSASIQEFWRRWHITLGDFLKKYLYIPLGGNRGGISQQCLALLTVMLLGGLWHGAGWTFVAWGGMHGLYLIANLIWAQYGKPLPRPLATGITFMAVMLAWVMFRAESVDDALVIWCTMFNLADVTLPTNLSLMLGHDVFSYADSPFILGIELLLVLALMDVVFRYRNTLALVDAYMPTYKTLTIVYVCLLASVISLSRPSTFLYFQF